MSKIYSLKENSSLNTSSNLSGVSQILIIYITVYPIRVDKKTNFISWCLLRNTSSICKIIISQKDVPIQKFRSSPPEVFLRKVVLKICIEFAAGHSYRSAISIKLQSNFIEIALQHGCSLVNFIFSEHLFLRTPLEGCFWKLHWFLLHYRTLY